MLMVWADTTALVLVALEGSTVRMTSTNVLLIHVSMVECAKIMSTPTRVHARLASVAYTARLMTTTALGGSMALLFPSNFLTFTFPAFLP